MKRKIRKGVLTVIHVPLVIPPHMESLAKGSQVLEPVIRPVMIEMYGGQAYPVTGGAVWL